MTRPRMGKKRKPKCNTFFIDCLHKNIDLGTKGNA